MYGWDDSDVHLWVNLTSLKVTNPYIHTYINSWCWMLLGGIPVIKINSSSKLAIFGWCTQLCSVPPLLWLCLEMLCVPCCGRLWTDNSPTTALGWWAHWQSRWRQVSQTNFSNGFVVRWRADRVDTGYSCCPTQVVVSCVHLPSMVSSPLINATMLFSEMVYVSKDDLKVGELQVCDWAIQSCGMSSLESSSWLNQGYMCSELQNYDYKTYSTC